MRRTSRIWQATWLDFLSGRGNIIAKLRAEGYKVVSFNPGRTTHRDIRELASELDEFVEEVCRREQVSEVALVAHSMGGLTARYYLEKLGGHMRVRKLFAISAPFAGTRTAYLALHSRAARHMTPRSKFIKELVVGHNMVRDSDEVVGL